LKNPYFVGFWVAIAVALTSLAIFFFGIAMPQAMTSEQSKNLERAFSYLNSVGTLLSGLASIIVACLGIYGFKTWKRQLLGGKSLGIIWDVKVALRAVELEHIEYFWRTLLRDPSIHNASLAERFDHFAKSDLSIALKELKKHCQALDKVVVRDEFMWTNFAGDLKMIEMQIVKSGYQASVSNAPKGHDSPGRKESLRLEDQRTDLIKYLGKKLDELEDKW